MLQSEVVMSPALCDRASVDPPLGVDMIRVSEGPDHAPTVFSQVESDRLAIWSEEEVVQAGLMIWTLF